MPKYVYSSTLDHPQWTNTTRLDGDLGNVVAELKHEHERDVVIHGSAQLAHALLEHDLIDELRLMVFPVLLGNGKRLFGATSDKKMLRLVDSQVAGDGVVILTYAAAPTPA
jgi:dihydrofolate reductase